MRTLLTLLASTFLLLACAKKEESTAFAPAERAARLETKVLEERPIRRLAYEHFVSVDTTEQRLQELFATIQARCREFSADACEVLESRISTGRSPSASLKLRLKPAGVQRIVALLNQGGTVVEQSTTAEDLAAPIADTQRRLALKTDYRAKLEELRKLSAKDVEALIKVNRELSEVQSEIEALTGTNTNLLRRVETEVVNISLHSALNRSFMRPISDAFSDFGTNLSQGIATAVTAIPFLIPWLVLLVVCTWVARKFWRRRRHGTTGA
jgi:glycine cleavage system regulatory protein